MATAQINARIDSRVKRAGDYALAEAGFSPTQAVKALWGFASRNVGDPDALLALFAQMEDDSAEALKRSELNRKVSLAQQGPLILEDVLKGLGVSTSAPREEAPYDELLADAYDERWSERGLLS